MERTNCFNRSVSLSNDIFGNGQCTGARDATNQAAFYGAFFRTVNVTEGVVADPFNADPAAPQLVAWRNPARTTWMWFDQNSGNLIYMVAPRPDLGKTLAFWFVNGGGWKPESAPNSSWDFVV